MLPPNSCHSEREDEAERGKKVVHKRSGQWVRNSTHTVFKSYICVGAAKNRCSSCSKNSEEGFQVRLSAAIRAYPRENRDVCSGALG